MTVEEFSTQDQFTASLIVFGMIFGAILLTLLWMRIRKLMASNGVSVSAFLLRPGILKVFIALRYLLACIGTATLVVTIFPGIMESFGMHENPNLGLGGIVFFLLWPILLLQTILGVIPWEKYLVKKPLLMWVLLFLGYVAALSVDTAAIRLMFAVD